MRFVKDGDDFPGLPQAIFPHSTVECSHDPNTELLINYDAGRTFVMAIVRHNTPQVEGPNGDISRNAGPNGEPKFTLTMDNVFPK
jgi:hypothetical protein